MLSRTLIEKLHQLSGEGSGLPAAIRLFNGDIVEIRDVRLSLTNAGEIHILAGPTEDDEDRMLNEAEEYRAADDGNDLP